MSFYPPKINARFQHPRFAGADSDADAVGKSATFVCGSAMRFSLRIDETTKEILEARFQTNACGYAIAAADVLAEKLVGKSLTRLHGADRTELRAEIFAELETFAADRTHCLELVLDALHAAFADFRVLRTGEFTGEKALICTCFGVTEERVEQLVAEKNLRTVEEVSKLCSAGDGCGSCRFLIAEIIDAHYREQI